MIFFLLAVAAMFAIAFWLILSPLLKSHDVISDESGELRQNYPSVLNNVSQADANIEIGRERLRELKADLVAGQIDDRQFKQMRTELEQSVLDAISGASVKSDSEHPKTSSASVKRSNNIGLILLVTIGLPVLTLAIYNEVGDTTFLNPEDKPNTQPVSSEGQTPDVEGMIQALSTRLQADPSDGEGWRMLGRSYMVLQRFDESAQAYANAYKILGDEVDLMVNYADALGRSVNGDLTGEAQPLIKKALLLEPEHSKARWLAGMLAYQTQDFKTALVYLQPLLKQMKEGSELHQGMSVLIGRVKEKLESANDPLISSQAEQVERVGQGTIGDNDKVSISLQVRVGLDNSLLDRVDKEETIFIFAKALSGPAMPLAVAKGQVKDLPLTVTLDDSSAMRPDLKISAYENVNISARISKSGNAIARAGDLQGTAENIAVASENMVEITINQQLK